MQGAFFRSKKLSFENESYSGKYSGKLLNTTNVESRFYCVMPSQFKGDTIKLEAYMKTKNVKNFAGIFIKTENTNGFIEQFEDMSSWKVNGNRDWQKYSISIPLTNKSKVIFVGGILSGTGEVWYDNFKITIDGKKIKNLKPFRKIDKALLDKEFDYHSKIKYRVMNKKLVNDLFFISKIWGFLKYYHPKIAQGDYNWDYELFRIIKKCGTTKTKTSRNLILTDWVNSLGTIPEIKENESINNTSKTVIKPNLNWINSNELGKALTVKLLHIYQNRNRKNNYYYSLRPGAKNVEFLNENEYHNISIPDQGFQLLALFKYWNAIEYFFPYKNIMDNNWDNILKDYIPIFLKIKTRLDYEIALTKLICQINDSHAIITYGNQNLERKKGKYYPPFKLQFIEDKLVVTENYLVNKKISTLDVGAVITKINNIPIKVLVDSLNPYYPSSNKAAKLRDIALNILRSNENTLNIEYEFNGLKNKNITLFIEEDLTKVDWDKNDYKKSYKLLNNNIGYITLRSIKEKDIKIIKKLFYNTSGIIIDMRNYPNTFVPFKLGSYFVSSPTPFVKFTHVIKDNPGEFVMTNSLEIKPCKNQYNGRLLLIVNEFTQSQSEYTAMAFMASNNTKVIGSRTAGTDGNVSYINLPGGISTRFSGLGVFFPNGNETQRVGICPDIIVKPTIKGIKNNRDELMEKAIEYITSKKW